MKLADLSLLLLTATCVTIFSTSVVDGKSIKEPGKQTWGYVEVRPGAFMFYWLYCTTATENYTQKPWVIWLQGGPGASSTGFGNFEEIGPMDRSLKNRTHSWLSQANLLFIDNPVGTGFSYVNDTKLLATNNTQIATDLLQLISKFLQKVPEFQTIPLYIFSESYGGKMAAQFALKLYKEIQKGKIKCNLKGVNLGDSWISPVDSVLTWAPFLFSTSMVDNAGFSEVNTSAYRVKAALDKKQFTIATNLWDETEGVIGKVTNGVNVYNILETDTESSVPTLAKEDHENDLSAIIPSVKDILMQMMPKPHKNVELMRNLETNEHDSKMHDKIMQIGAKHLKKFHSDPLSELMNGPIKKMLRIIPANVTWGGQSQKVFAALGEDFMKPVVRVVENLLNNTNIAVNVYSGQLDLIVDTMGTLKWVEEMNWPGIPGWKKAPRKPIVLNNSTEMFVKSFKNFGFYWILKAGHMVPADQPQTAQRMLQLIANLAK